MAERYDVLAFGAHPDDLEAVMGGAGERTTTGPTPPDGGRVPRRGDTLAAGREDPNRLAVTASEPPLSPSRSATGLQRTGDLPLMS